MKGENSWFATEAGQALVDQSMQQASPWVSPLCGHNALLLQPHAQMQFKPALQCGPPLHLSRHEELLIGDFIATDKTLPIASDCVALVYAAFVLETSATPALLLAEFERLLVSEGHLALFTLNPYSLYRCSARWKGLVLKPNGFWTQYLQNIGLEIVQHKALGPLWPSAERHSSARNSYRPSALCSVNFILAKKRKLPLTPLRKTANAVALARELSHP